MDNFYRAEFVAPGMWLCIRGDDYMAAPIYDSRDEAEEAVGDMNGRYYADGSPANASARAFMGSLS